MVEVLVIKNETLLSNSVCTNCVSHIQIGDDDI